ncbi:MAG TPA: hypothetical protein VFZ09_13405 [Archangium sp.]|uniref:hypothetical protein n=1 Tax=Archangium sp. TaxID=1872627 RepID=UPI002E363DE0|nr:hypothetical protein [Archangium sp.]HEX5747234.1 hypothetical protein [Archangium sp.]
MPRKLTKAEQERSLRWGQERDRLFLSLRDASAAEKIRAYKQFERRRLKEAHSALEQREVRRRVAEDLIMATSDGPWRLFSPYLRRLERLGYSTMDRQLLACVLSAKASKGSRAGRRKAADLIADVERRTRGRKYHPALREEINRALARARSFAGLDTGTSGAESKKEERGRRR